MSKPASVTAIVYVALEREEAFRIFTEEIDAWYKRGPHSFHEPDKAVGLRFEPWLGGRFIEVHDAVTGEGIEIGRVSVWEPGRRLVWTDTEGTEVDVQFDAYIGGGDAQTRVRLEHRGLERLAPGRGIQVRDYGWWLPLGWFEEHVTHERRRHG
jgi:hypothetical protein